MDVGFSTVSGSGLRVTLTFMSSCKCGYKSPKKGIIIVTLLTNPTYNYP